MTTNFETRSSGFQWFFSFIVAFSEFERKQNVIVLLDEPALNLHARAQSDLLNFINKRLGPKSQVIYTTHSPFLVDPRKLDAVRLVEDLTSRDNPDIGSKVSVDVLAVKGDTLFPLQAALGYDLAQNIFVGPDNLVVEGTSDLVYLNTLSDFLAQSKRTCLDPRFTITPVGGADKIPTFIALLGTHLDLTVLVDANAAKSQKLADMIKMGLLKSSRLASVSQISSIPGANIEDLFEPDEYIGFYNQAFSTTIKITNLKGADSIVNRIERFRTSQYDHLAPALALLRSSAASLPALSETTLSRFEKLFAFLNSTLPPAVMEEQKSPLPG